MSAPMNPSDVARHLIGLARELQGTVAALESADMDATQKRAAFDLAYSRAFVGAQGAMDARKHHAVLATEAERQEADVAEAVVRHLRRKLDAIKVRIDIGRSYGAAVRSELSLVNSGVET